MCVIPIPIRTFHLPWPSPGRCRLPNPVFSLLKKDVYTFRLDLNIEKIFYVREDNKQCVHNYIECYKEYITKTINTRTNPRIL